MKDQIKFFATPALAVGTFLLMLLLYGAGVSVMVAAGIDGLICKPSDSLGIQLLFGFWLLVGAFGFWNARQNFCTVTLTQESVVLRIPFQKSNAAPYTHYPHIQRGRYFHGIAGMGYWVHFIVFSKHKLSVQQLNKINSVPNSSDIFKIRYSPRIMKKLLSVLPQPHCHKLNCAFNQAPKI